MGIVCCVVCDNTCRVWQRQAHGADTLWSEGLVDWPLEGFPDHGSDGKNQSIGYSTQNKHERPEMFRPFFDQVNFRIWCLFQGEIAVQTGDLVEQDSTSWTRAGTMTNLQNGASDFTTSYQKLVQSDSLILETYDVSIVADEISPNGIDWFDGQISYQKYYENSKFTHSEIFCYLSVQGRYRGFFRYKEEVVLDTADGLVKHYYYFSYPQYDESVEYKVTDYVGIPIDDDDGVER